MTDQPPHVQIESTAQSWRSQLSIVWIIPIVALIIALAVVWQSYSSRGPLIEIAFDNGAGVGWANRITVPRCDRRQGGKGQIL